MQEYLKLLKKSEVFVNDFTENVCELIADKLRSDENFISQMFNEKDKNEMKIHKMQIIFCKINKLTHESEKIDLKIKYNLQKNKESLHKKVNIFTKTSEF